MVQWRTILLTPFSSLPTPNGRSKSSPFSHDPPFRTVKDRSLGRLRVYQVTINYDLGKPPRLMPRLPEAQCARSKCGNTFILKGNMLLAPEEATRLASRNHLTTLRIRLTERTLYLARIYNARTHRKAKKETTAHISPSTTVPLKKPKKRTELKTSYAQRPHDAVKVACIRAKGTIGTGHRVPEVVRRQARPSFTASPIFFVLK